MKVLDLQQARTVEIIHIIRNIHCDLVIQDRQDVAC